MASQFAGRWDLVVTDDSHSFPSWLELTECESGWLGRFVGEVGSARPIRSAKIDGDTLEFCLPPQYEGYPNDLSFTGVLKDGELTGTTNTRDGGSATWKAVKAPALPGKANPVYSPEKSLIGTDLAGWRPRWPERENHWAVVEGALVNQGVGTDLVSVEAFNDFKLVAEYSYPEGSNSGIYLRGRYEIQILDDYGRGPGVGISGGVYGFHSPSVNAIKPHGERNIAEITLLGRELTIVLNGTVIQDAVTIPGITGGALDSEEGQPGPILLQGDHGPVTFHRLLISPVL